MSGTNAGLSKAIAELEWIAEQRRMDEERKKRPVRIVPNDESPIRLSLGGVEHCLGITQARVIGTQLLSAVVKARICSGDYHRGSEVEE